MGEIRKIYTSAGWCNTGEFAEYSFKTFADALRECPEFRDVARGDYSSSNALLLYGEGTTALVLPWWEARAVWAHGGDHALMEALLSGSVDLESLPEFDEKQFRRRLAGATLD